jgi:hypothetical protein
MIFFISHLFSPSGRAGGSHMLRYKGIVVVYYDFALKCTALLHEASDFLKLGASPCLWKPPTRAKIR